MIETRTTRPQSAKKSARLVWLIVLLGVGTAGVTLCLVRAALNGIRVQRIQLSAMQDAVDDLSNDIGHGFDEISVELQRLLAGQSEAAPTQQRLGSMEASLTHFNASQHGIDVGSVVKQTQTFLTNLKSLRDQCTDWNAKNATNLAKLTDNKKAVENSMIQMRAALSSAEGRAGLKLVGKIRHFRKMTGQPALDEAVAIIGYFGTNGDSTEIRVEVSNLALLCQQLLGEEDIDHLADLKDNLFLASLFRLNRVIARSGDTDPVFQHDMMLSSQLFQNTVFGNGCTIDGDHQTILVEPDGLYSLCRQRLELRQARETLRAQLARRSDEYAKVDQGLDTISNSLKDNITSKVQGILSSNWHNLLLFSLFCAIALVSVGKLIANNIRHQITVITEATANLQRSNAQMAAIHNTSLDCVLVLDSSWNIVSFNPAAARAFKCSYQDALGRALRDFINPPDPSAPGGFPTSGENSILGKLVEVTARQPDGSTFPVEMAITAAEMDGPPLYIASLRDLTERKKADADREELNDRLLKASRHAGMAEVATGVLHNVGNVLNSVNVSASVVTNKLRQSEVSSLTKVSEMLREHPSDLGQFLTEDERGKLVPGFISDLAVCLGQEQTAMLDELSVLSKGIEHIKEIVSAQQSLAKKGTVRIATGPVKLMETALTMQGNSFEADQIELIRRFEAVPNLPLDQHKIVQILVNLIANAKHAVKSGGNTPRQIKLIIELVEGGEGKRIRFAVEDNGVGIAAQHLTRMFSHGFTTKPDGHGFGLHSAANAATEMRGTLTAASEGLGKGSKFTLELPAEVNQKEEACPA
jgi:PAS domain S-box-containing protein